MILQVILLRAENTRQGQMVKRLVEPLSLFENHDVFQGLESQGLEGGNSALVPSPHAELDGFDTGGPGYLKRL